MAPRASTAARDRPRAGAHVVVRTGRLLGRRFAIDGEHVIGRSGESSILVDDKEASRSHAVIRKQKDGTFQLCDLGSRNGTFVNEERIGAIDLQLGDAIRIGRTLMVLCEDDPIAEQNLQTQRLETLGRLCVGVVHDLNNALAVVSSGAGYLREQPEHWDADTLECIDDIELASNHATKLARQLLSFARGDGAAAGPVDIESLLGDVVKLAQRTFPQGIEVETSLAAGLSVHAEASRLNQIFLNLLVNARDAITCARPSGRIVVTARHASVARTRSIEVTVADDGAGMDAETRERLFEPFFTTKSAGKGFGVGLATVAELVRDLGGRIRVDSELGKGSVFRIELPEANEESGPRLSPTPAQGTRQQLRKANGERILVVDADACARRTLKRVLGRVGFDVLGAEDGAAALALTRENDMQIAGVLLDLDAFGASETETLTRLAEQRPDLPVIAISVTNDQQSLARTQARGAYAVLSKLSTPAEIVMCVFDAIDRIPRHAIHEEQTRVSG